MSATVENLGLLPPIGSRISIFGVNIDQKTVSMNAGMDICVMTQTVDLTWRRGEGRPGLDRRD